MDGRLLAQARQQKEQQRREAVAEDRRRHEIAYARVPALRRLDERIAALVTEAAASAVSGGSVDALRRESLDLQARRAELLVENGWPIDWLDGAWSCPKCRDEGYVHGRMCRCLKELYEQARSRDLSALLKLGDESFGAFDLTLYDSRPDPATGVSPRSVMETVFDICCDFAAGFSSHRENFLFRGNTGLGKTYLAACIAREVSRQGFSVVYGPAAETTGAFENRRFARDEQADALVRRMMQCDLLIVDDLGTEPSTDMARSALYTLVDSRLNAQRSTIITTNLTAEQLARRYTPQIVSRLEGEYTSLRFVGRDIRLMKKERTGL